LRRAALTELEKQTFKSKRTLICVFSFFFLHGEDQFIFHISCRMQNDYCCAVVMKVTMEAIKQIVPMVILIIMTMGMMNPTVVVVFEKIIVFTARFLLTS